MQLRLTWQEPYCGGARPTPEMEAEAEKQKPYANKTVILVSDKKKVDSLRTDSSGTLTLKLKRGRYKLLEPWRYYKSTPDGRPLANYDTTCLKELWGKEFRRVDVGCGKRGTQDIYQLTRSCDWSQPCITGEGAGHVPD